MKPNMQELEKIIPYLSLASEDEQLVFFNSIEGQDLYTKIKKGFFNNTSLTVNADSLAARQQQRYANQRKISLYLQDLFSKTAYLRIRQSIISQLLKNKYFALTLLDKEELYTLANTSYSISLYSETPMDFEKWNNAFQNDRSEDINPIFNKKNHAYNLVLELAQKQFGFLFNNLNDLKDEELIHFIKIIYQPFIMSSEKKNILNQEINSRINADFNWPKPKEEFSLVSYLYNYLPNDYEKSLKWLTANKLIPEGTNPKELINDIISSHCFLKYLNLVGEIDSDPVAMMKAYTWAPTFKVWINTVNTLLKPQHELFHEYAELGHHEKNRLMIIIRFVVPLVIIALCLVLFFDLMAPLAISALLEIFLFIPVVYLATAVASLYVQLKNEVVTAFLIYQWGDLYKTPQFQVSERLLLSFSGDSRLAHDIANYYIDSLKTCDAIESAYKSRSNTCFNNDKIDARKYNLEKKLQLEKEWYQINLDTSGYDETPDRVSKRLYNDVFEEYPALIEKSKDYVDSYVKDLHHRIENTDEQQLEHANMRWAFFNRDNPVKELDSQCRLSQKKIKNIEKLYPEVNKYIPSTTLQP